MSPPLALAGPPGWLGRFRLSQARRRLQLARYWQANGDLDEAARHASRALRLLDGRSVEVTGEAALTVADIERDRCEYASSYTRLAGLAGQLSAAAASGSASQLLLARVLVSLGDAHRRSGQYRQATETLQRACGLLGDTEPSLLAAALTTLAITHKEAGEFGQAHRLYKWVQQIRQESGASTGQQADLHHNLAGLAYAEQYYEQAEQHAREALALRRAAGANAVGLAPERAVLAAALAARHRYGEARLELEGALAACRASQPPRRYEIAVQLHTLAAVEQACGLADRAESLYREALALKEDLLGPGHPEVALILNNLGSLLCEQHRRTEAVELFSRALAVAQGTLRPGHPTTAGIFRNLQTVNGQV
ncbi:MAG TPA: tetratricopeptide repeat protein [Streptosporangiaceae bacterium]|nr:tetratricopeptide repeat protein [Streptosporangiaceae bacterium]